jgi:hypothetical protein
VALQHPAYRVRRDNAKRTTRYGFSFWHGRTSIVAYCGRDCNAVTPTRQTIPPMTNDALPT